MTTPGQAAPQNVVWFPQAGPQTEACLCPVDVIKFGGSRGSGKSDVLLGRQFFGAITYGHLWNGLIIRRKYKDLKELRRRIAGLIRNGLPAELVGGEQQTNVLRFKNGGLVTITAMQYQEALNDWIGHQFVEISIDEAPQLPFFTTAIDKLRGSLRSAGGVRGHIFCTGNPGGPGHGQVKNFFRLGSGGNPPKVPFFVETEHNGIIHRESRVYIPSFLTDNKILCDADPQYVSRLAAISDPVLRKAWLDGDWDVFIGQAFEVTSKHIIPNQPVPEFAPIYMTYDWGFGKPFSIGWWWSDRENRLYRFAEWYGYSGKEDDGLRMVDSAIADGIIAKEHELGIESRVQIRLCDPTSFNKRADTYGGGQGPSTADIFAEKGIPLTPGDPNRKLKIRAVRERLAIPRDGSPPMMMVYENCSHFIRTIPQLAIDEENPEEIDDGQEDHCLHGGTLIETEQGSIPIKELVNKKGKILTAGGYWTDFSDCRLTRKDADVVKVEFENGKVVTCTDDHKFFTKTNGYIRARDLTNETCHISISLNQHLKEATIWKSRLLTKQRKSLMVKDIGYAVSIFKEKVLDCIELFGNFSMVKFLKELIPTIKTETVQTINQIILCLNLQVNTCLCMVKRTITQHGLSLCIPGLLHGMEANRALNGISSNIKNTVKTKCMLRKVSSANIVVNHTKGYHSANIVQENVSNENGKIKTANPEHVLCAETALSDSGKLVQVLVQQEKRGQLVKARSVKPAGKADVYCLNAADTHAFCVEGGILVHNCYDESALIAMFFTVPMLDIKPKKTQAEIDWEIITGVRSSGTQSSAAFIASD